MRRFIRVVGYALLCGAALVPGVLAWRATGDTSMSWQGWAALIGGALATAALGGGLMALVFYSNRSGFDDRADETAASVLPQDDPER